MLVISVWCKYQFKIRDLHAYDMDVEWFGFILGLAMAKECTMAHG
jgi:hypothetical protein